MSGKILLYRGSGLIGNLIRWQTRSPYSHAAIVVSETHAVEAREFCGVRKVKIDWEDPNMDVFDIDGMSEWQWSTAVNFAEDQIGKKYDYLAVARFITRSPERRNDKWFCSELVFSSVAVGGVTLLDRIEDWAVSPGLLSLSPLLIPVKVRAERVVQFRRGTAFLRANPQFQLGLAHA